VGCDSVRWQGATTLRAHAREEEQRSQRTESQFNRVRSAVTLEVTVDVGEFVSVDAVYPAQASGQLLFLG
jgi:hypothetical protein